MSIPLEDTQADVISKAMRGLGISESTLADKSGRSPEEIAAVRSGENRDPELLGALAPALNLNAGALIGLAVGGYPDEEPEAPEGLARFNTPFEDMTVNSYLIWDLDSNEAAAFDSGADCSDALDVIEAEGLQLTHIFLTHTHGDHVFDVERLVEKTGATVYVSELEPFAGATLFKPGDCFNVGALSVSTRATIGHSRGGTTFVVSGLSLPVGIVGDAIFAGSMGGGGVSYEQALATNRSEILTLPGETILCPGHGPMTIVNREKMFNPFFP